MNHMTIANVTGCEDVDSPTRQQIKYEIASKLNDALNLAVAAGFVVTVELEPLQPLAMRNYRMIGNVRAAR